MRFKILDGNGGVINTIMADLAFVQEKYPGRYMVINENDIAPVAAKTKMTQLAFKKRFPPAKWKAARAAATPGSDLYDFFEDWTASTYIDLSRNEQVIIPVNSLTNGAVPAEYRLTSSEAIGILTNPITEGEKYHGQ